MGSRQGFIRTNKRKSKRKKYGSITYCWAIWIIDITVIFFFFCSRLSAWLVVFAKEKKMFCPLVWHLT
jgi:hypothetical protein